MSSRGNPNWGKPAIPDPVLPTGFEQQVEKLALRPEEYQGSPTAELVPQEREHSLRPRVPAEIVGDTRPRELGAHCGVNALNSQTLGNF